MLIGTCRSAQPQLKISPQQYESARGYVAAPLYNQILRLFPRQGLLGVEPPNMANIAKELAVSRTPVNVALTRLE